MKINKEKIRTFLFAPVMAIFIAVPLIMIFRYQKVLDEGTLYRFSCKPIDPADALRGKYVALDFTQSIIDYPHADRIFKRNETLLYVSVKTDSNGFARIIKVSDTAGSGNNYFVVNNFFAYSDRLLLYFPFNRYYMNEKNAPEAEKIYRNEAKSDSTYVTVRIYNGKAILEELYVEGVPIHDYIKSHNPL